MSKKLLVADDNEHNLTLLLDVLDRFKVQGVTILSADDGTKTFDIITKEKPDLVLLDVEMPGMDGYEICKRVKADPAMRDVYVIMVTAQAEVDQRKKAAELGVDEYITKPFDIRQVRDRVRTVLELTSI